MVFLTILFVNQGEVVSVNSLSFQRELCDDNTCYCKEIYVKKIQRAWRRYSKIIKLRKRAFRYLKERQYKKACLR